MNIRGSYLGGNRCDIKVDTPPAILLLIIILLAVESLVDVSLFNFRSFSTEHISYGCGVSPMPLPKLEDQGIPLSGI
jgi:hypothetical protein